MLFSAKMFFDSTEISPVGLGNREKSKARVVSAQTGTIELASIKTNSDEEDGKFIKSDHDLIEFDGSHEHGRQDLCFMQCTERTMALGDRVLSLSFAKT